MRPTQLPPRPCGFPEGRHQRVLCRKMGGDCHKTNLRKSLGRLEHHCRGQPGRHRRARVETRQDQRLNLGACHKAASALASLDMIRMAYTGSLKPILAARYGNSGDFGRPWSRDASTPANLRRRPVPAPSGRSGRRQYSVRSTQTVAVHCLASSEQTGACRSCRPYPHLASVVLAALPASDHKGPMTRPDGGVGSETRPHRYRSSSHQPPDLLLVMGNGIQARRALLCALWRGG